MGRATIQSVYLFNLKVLEALRSDDEYWGKTLFADALSPESRIIWFALQEFTDDEGVCNPSHKDLVELVNIPERTMIRHLKRLEEAGCIVIRKRGEGTRNNLYQLRKPPWWDGVK